MAQVVNCSLITAKPLVQSQANLSEIYDIQSGTRTGCFQVRTWVLLSHYGTTNTPYTFNYQRHHSVLAIDSVVK